MIKDHATASSSHVTSLVTSCDDNAIEETIKFHMVMPWLAPVQEF